MYIQRYKNNTIDLQKVNFGFRVKKEIYPLDRHTFWIRKQEEAVKDTEGNIMKITYIIQVKKFSKINKLTANSDNDWLKSTKQPFNKCLGVSGLT